RQSQRQSAVRYGHGALRVHVDENAAVDLRLRHEHAAENSAQARGSSRRLRSGGVRDRAGFRAGAGWNRHSDLAALPKGMVRNGGNPLLLYGYGSYGFSIDAAFSSPRLSLVDRGFIYAIAHVRGGQEMGRSWYEAGKLLHKKNTFSDFIACAEYLIGEKFTAPEKLFAMGRSAGGLLMGAVSNLRP